MKELDVNNDGVVSYEEFKAMMQGITPGSVRFRQLAEAEAVRPKSVFTQFRSVCVFMCVCVSVCVCMCVCVCV